VCCLVVRTLQKLMVCAVVLCCKLFCCKLLVCVHTCHADANVWTFHTSKDPCSLISCREPVITHDLSCWETIFIHVILAACVHTWLVLRNHVHTCHTCVHVTVVYTSKFKQTSFLLFLLLPVECSICFQKSHLNYSSLGYYVIFSAEIFLHCNLFLTGDVCLVLLTL